jgi:hypothetical protein
MLTKIKHKLGGLKALNILPPISLLKNLKLFSTLEADKYKILFKNYPSLQNKSKFTNNLQRG